MIKFKKETDAARTALPVCPKCGLDDFRRTAFRSSDSFWIRQFCKAYRCRRCRHRFFLVNKLLTILSSIIGGLLLLMTMAWVVQQFAMPELEAEDIAAYNSALERAKAGNNGAAELQVGLLLSEGRGIVKNEKEAGQWFKKAAQQGNVEAEYQYGNALFKGIGLLQNYREAIYWIEKAARAGHLKAQYDLGNIYRFKSGVEGDPKRAYLWLTIAAGQGSLEAAIGRDQMEGRLKPEEIAALQEEARQIISDSK